MKLSIKQIKTIKTTKYICVSCKRPYVTLPNYQDLDKGDECPLCGCTGFNITKGRVIGRKSIKWDEEMIKFTLENMPNPKQYFLFN